MRKEVIAVDIDDVLAANAEGFVAFSNERWKTNLRPEDYHEHWSELWGVDIEETNKRSTELHASGTVTTYMVKDRAFPVLELLGERFKLVVVTSRRRTIDTETRRWLDTHYQGIFDSVVFAGIYDEEITTSSFLKTKVDALRSTSAAYLIDDQLKHCLAAKAAGVEAILFGDYSWNQTNDLPDGITRCHDWLAVQEYFNARG